MKINFSKISEIYGKNTLYDFKENIEDITDNINYLFKLGFTDVYDILELYPHMFYMSSDIFSEKVNLLIHKLGEEYLSILDEDTTLWGGVEIDK